MPRKPLPVTPDPVAPGQESVWDYPRPAVAEPTSLRVEITHLGRTVADSSRAVRVIETSHPPTYYLPPDDVAVELLRPASQRSWCEWKGQAIYFDLVIGEAVVPSVAWAYPRPTPAFMMLKDHLAFYAAPLDQCRVGGEAVTPQPGGFYGGWITRHVCGPFKGVPGSRFW